MKIPYCAVQLKTCQLYLKSLEETITNENTSIHTVLPHINSLLQSAVLTCTAAMSSNQADSLEKFQSEKIGSTQKMDHQWQFRQTTKASGRKKGCVLRYCLLL